MGKIYFQPELTDEVEAQFREKANKRYKNKHGAFNNTIKDLIEAFTSGAIKLPPKK